ncbi:MAG: acylneuraminate cytidylyltransferase family protein [Clostridium sp.]|uniref:acylneuraminate cytidylyltransferase family protein n=1 Tax=Clostridium sp. DSM 8431 TaxID=1761781 RepID=UPI0015873EF4|nr:acylneuraminate cytidylyltransferase family protein [Clostridium sp. DSM 8431]MCR4943547.1 acylneuraminate cytidylyltransferase family protein [Clostridium sp.]
MAVITARGGSKGIKNKNIKKLNGIPLIDYSFQACKNSKYLDKVILSSDDKNIIDFAISKGIEVPFVRPPELATDEATSFSVIKHAVNFFENIGENFDYIVTIQPTSPFRTSNNIDEAIESLINDGEADSLVSVSDIEYHPYWMKKINNGYLEPFMSIDEKSITRRQNLPQLYKMNGAIFISKKILITEGTAILGEKVKPYYMDLKASIDIDTIEDFKMAEYVLKNKEL